jgi:hypothetical protein
MAAVFGHVEEGVMPLEVVGGWLARPASQRGDPRERLAAAAGVDHRLGELVREALPMRATPEEDSAMVEAPLDPERGATASHEDLTRVQADLALQPMLGILVQ